MFVKEEINEESERFLKQIRMKICINIIWNTGKFVIKEVYNARNQSGNKKMPKRKCPNKMPKYPTVNLKLLAIK